jgi:hypothetical protein
MGFKGSKHEYMEYLLSEYADERIALKVFNTLNNYQVTAGGRLISSEVFEAYMKAFSGKMPKRVELTLRYVYEAQNKSMRHLRTVTCMDIDMQPACSEYTKDLAYHVARRELYTPILASPQAANSMLSKVFGETVTISNLVKEDFTIF